jgi:hypothetical protein
MNCSTGVDIVEEARYWASQPELGLLFHPERRALADIGRRLRTGDVRCDGRPAWTAAWVADRHRCSHRCAT